jgi:hypothetical protein
MAQKGHGNGLCVNASLREIETILQKRALDATKLPLWPRIVAMSAAHPPHFCRN